MIILKQKTTALTLQNKSVRHYHRITFLEMWLMLTCTLKKSIVQIEINIKRNEKIDICVIN
jgi:hypothetical protein